MCVLICAASVQSGQHWLELSGEGGGLSLSSGAGAFCGHAVTEPLSVFFQPGPGPVIRLIFCGSAPRQLFLAWFLSVALFLAFLQGTFCTIYNIVPLLSFLLSTLLESADACLLQSFRDGCKPCQAGKGQAGRTGLHSVVTAKGGASSSLPPVPMKIQRLYVRYFRLFSD